MGELGIFGVIFVILVIGVLSEEAHGYWRLS